MQIESLFDHCIVRANDIFSKGRCLVYLVVTMFFFIYFLQYRGSNKNLKYLRDFGNIPLFRTVLEMAASFVLHMCRNITYCIFNGSTRFIELLKLNNHCPCDDNNVILFRVCQLFTKSTREGFLRKNIVAVSFFQNCAIHQYS